MELTTLQNGRYHIEGILGRGGFGITYRAVQTSLGRTVAIKEFFMKDYCERAEDSTLGLRSEFGKSVSQKLSEAQVWCRKVVAQWNGNTQTSFKETGKKTISDYGQ